MRNERAEGGGALNARGDAVLGGQPYVMVPKRCSHRKEKFHCAECNPCPHGKRKDMCAECNPCPHSALRKNGAMCTYLVDVYSRKKITTS
ncbi:hypothetical protein N9L76_04980 [bacterium]|nr:hypothetical protein [bacterium]